MMIRTFVNGVETDNPPEYRYPKRRSAGYLTGDYTGRVALYRGKPVVLATRPVSQWKSTYTVVEILENGDLGKLMPTWAGFDREDVRITWRPGMTAREARKLINELP